MAMMGASAVVTQNRAVSRAGQVAFRAEPRRRTVVFQGQVLLIENLRERSQLMRDMLTQERFEVGVVDDAQDALALLSDGLVSEQSKQPELIICNARMLGEAGLQALALLSQSHPDVPVILYSPFTSPKLRAAMTRVEGAFILDASSDLEDLRSAALTLAPSRQTSL
jgi:CheY-like chemotaxis protein